MGLLVTTLASKTKALIIVYAKLDISSDPIKLHAKVITLIPFGQNNASQNALLYQY